MNVIKHVLRNFGPFQILYTDRAVIFGKNHINQFDVVKDHTFSLDGKIYDLEESDEYYADKEVEIRSYPCGKVCYFVDDKEISLKQTENIAI